MAQHYDSVQYQDWLSSVCRIWSHLSSTSDPLKGGDGSPVVRCALEKTMCYCLCVLTTILEHSPFRGYKTHPVLSCIAFPSANCLQSHGSYNYAICMIYCLHSTATLHLLFPFFLNWVNLKVWCFYKYHFNIIIGIVTLLASLVWERINFKRKYILEWFNLEKSLMFAKFCSVCGLCHYFHTQERCLTAGFALREASSVRIRAANTRFYLKKKKKKKLF